MALGRAQVVFSYDSSYLRTAVVRLHPLALVSNHIFRHINSIAYELQQAPQNIFRNQYIGVNATRLLERVWCGKPGTHIHHPSLVKRLGFLYDVIGDVYEE